MTRETILVTGATGFIGSHVVEALLSQGSYSILAIVRKNRNDEKIEALRQKGVIVVEGEFYDPILLEKMFQEHSIHHVIHLAALRGAGKGSWGDYIKINVTGTEILLGAALDAGVKRFIHCSTVGVCGTTPAEVPANLSTSLNGDSAYHKSKILGENKVNEFIRRGLNAFILRPTITYGPEDNGFPSTLVDLVRHRKLFVPCHEVMIHLLDVSTLADLITRMLQAGGLERRVFIVADKEPVGLKRLVDLIHGHYYRTKYPTLLKLPSFSFSLLRSTFRVIGNEKWLTRISLISRNWYYDIADTVRTLEYDPVNTEESFVQYLKD